MLARLALSPAPHTRTLLLTHRDQVTFCTGFLALLPTLRTLGMLTRWNVELMKIPQLNQPLWNR